MQNRTSRFRRTTMVGWAAASALALAIAGCGSDDEPSGETAAGGGSQAGSITQADIDTALKYVGGTAGKADSTKEPFSVGFVNNQGGAVGFPDQEAAADAVVSLVNEQLGGIGGHPLKLEKCFVKSEEDGQRCAAELRNKNVLVGNWGVTIFGEQSFFKTVGGKFPILASTTAFPMPPKVYKYDGGSPANYRAIVANAITSGKKIALIGGDNPAIRTGFADFVLPALREKGANARPVYVSDTGTTPDWVTGLQNSGAAEADAIIANPTTSGGCAAFYDAMKQLTIEKPVYGLVQCSADPMPEKTGGGPENFTVSTLQDIALIKSPETDVYNAVMKQYGHGDKSNTGFTIRTFDDLMTITKFANEIGYDDLSADAFDKAIREFKGPAWGIPGPLACNGNEAPPALRRQCGISASNSTYRDGAWQRLEPFSDPTLRQ